MMVEKANDSRNKQLELSYLELKRYYDNLAKANDQIDQKMMYMFSSIGIVLTLFGFSEFDSLIIHDAIHIIIFIIIGINLLIFLISFFLVIFPQVQPYPIDATFESLINIFYEKDRLEEVYYQVNSNYIHYININEKINKSKSRLLRVSMITYALILIFSLTLIFFY